MLGSCYKAIEAHVVDVRERLRAKSSYLTERSDPSNCGLYIVAAPGRQKLKVESWHHSGWMVQWEQQKRLEPTEEPVRLETFTCSVVGKRRTCATNFGRVLTQ